MMPILPQPGQPPVFTGAGQMYTTVMLAFGVMTALHHRQQTGEGQEVDVSLFAGNMYGAALDVQASLAMGGERFLHPVSRLDAGNPMSGTLYQSKDGRWVTLTMPDTDRWWPGLAEIVGLDPADPRFDSHDKRCEENRLELIGVLEQAFQQQSGAHWRSAFNELVKGYTKDYLAGPLMFKTGTSSVVPVANMLHTFPSRNRVSGQSEHAKTLHDSLGYPEERIAELEASGGIV